MTQHHQIIKLSNYPLIRLWYIAITHLSLGCSDSSPARVNVLVDGGEEVLRYPQGILKDGEVRVVLRSVFQQVLKHTHNMCYIGAFVGVI